MGYMFDQIKEVKKGRPMIKMAFVLIHRKKLLFFTALLYFGLFLIPLLLVKFAWGGSVANT